MDKEELTHLRISYNWKTKTSHLFAAKEWDDNVQWGNYNKSFYVSTTNTLIKECCYYNDNATQKLFAKHNLQKYLSTIINLLEQGKHLFIDCFYCKKYNIRFMNNVHSDILGINNRSHAIRMGGIRRHELGEKEYDVIIDGLNLGRAMSFKNFASKIPCGGTKMTIMMDPVDLDNLGVIGFLSYALDRSRTCTGPDMGFPTELADVMKKHFTTNIVGGPNGPLGPTGKPTAYGAYLATKQAAKFKFGSTTLKGKSIAIQGLGATGYYLAKHYIEDGASLYVADIDEQVCHNFKKENPNANIKIIEPEEILFVDADIFSPCAIGGIITKEIIPKLKFKIIIGCANNQLNASNQEEEFTLARELDKQNILFQVGWWHNVGGVLCGAEEYKNQENASINNVLKKIEEICTKHTWENLTTAKKNGITPTENAYKSTEAVIYQK